MLRMDRVERLVRELASQGLDAAIVSYGANLYYLTGFYEEGSERHLSLTIDREGSINLVVPKLYEAQVLRDMGISGDHESSTVSLCVWEDHEGPYRCVDKVVSELRGRGFRRVAVEGGMRSSFLIDIISRAGGDLSFIDGDPILYRLRMIKDEAEIEKISESCRALVRVFEEFISRLNISGSTREIDLANLLRSVALELGYSLSFDPIVSSGPNTAYPHYRFGYRRISRGDVIIVDFGIDLDHYKSDFTRVLSVGAPSSRVEELYTRVREAQRRAIDSIKEGVRASDIDRAARGYLAEWGLDRYFIHRTGHGLGLEIHEKPDISAGDPTVVREGMVFTVEPGVYFEGVFGLRVEDTVIVRSGGPYIATEYERDIVRV